MNALVGNLHQNVGQVGELVIRKPWPSMLRSIYGDKARYKKQYWSEIPGCYFAGDGAKLDQDGDIWLLGRVDDVMNISGHRISTLEVESALVDHPAVAEAAGALAASVAQIETLYNPNKHRLAERTSDLPEPGEVWIASRDEAPVTQIAGRRLPGVTAIRRRTAWRLLDDAGQDIAPSDRDRAVATFLCNPAFQVAIT